MSPPAHHPGLAWADQGVRFETGRSTLSPSSMPAIASIARDLKSDPAIRLVEVQGHADERAPSRPTSN